MLIGVLCTLAAGVAQAADLREILGPADYEGVKNHIVDCAGARFSDGPPSMEPVSVVVTFDRAGSPVDLQFSDTKQLSNPMYRASAESIRRALLAPACRTWPLPPMRYELWKKATLIIDRQSYSRLWQNSAQEPAAVPRHAAIPLPEIDSNSTIPTYAPTTRQSNITQGLPGPGQGGYYVLMASPVFTKGEITRATSHAPAVNLKELYSEFFEQCLATVGPTESKSWATFDLGSLSLRGVVAGVTKRYGPYNTAQSAQQALRDAGWSAVGKEAGVGDRWTATVGCN